MFKFHSVLILCMSNCNLFKQKNQSSNKSRLWFSELSDNAIFCFEIMDNIKLIVTGVPLFILGNNSFPHSYAKFWELRC